MPTHITKLYLFLLRTAQVCWQFLRVCKQRCVPGPAVEASETTPFIPTLSPLGVTSNQTVCARSRQENYIPLRYTPEHNANGPASSISSYNRSERREKNEVRKCLARRSPWGGSRKRRQVIPLLIDELCSSP